MDIIFIPFPFMWQPRSLAGHRGAGKESSSKNSLCGSPPGNEDTVTMFSRGEYGSGNWGSVWWYVFNVAPGPLIWLIFDLGNPSKTF